MISPNQNNPPSAPKVPIERPNDPPANRGRAPLRGSPHIVDEETYAKLQKEKEDARKAENQQIIDDQNPEPEDTKPPVENPPPDTKPDTKPEPSDTIVDESSQEKAEVEASPEDTVPDAVVSVIEPGGVLEEEVDSSETTLFGFQQTSQTAVVVLAMGLTITALLLIFVGCRLRNVKRRLRRGRPLNSNEADYLINGMYL
jgi:hypothetical protein